MCKTSSSVPNSYLGLSGSFFIDSSSSGRAGYHPVSVGSVRLRSDQSVRLVSMSGWILCSQIQTEGGRVSSSGAELGGMASSTL